jgi:hypothetical protein
MAAPGSRFRASHPVFLAYTLLAVLAASGTAAPAPHPRDRGGPTVVHNTRKEVQRAPRVSLQPELVIGEHGVFGKPSDIAVSHDGRVFVLDDGFKKVFAFDDQGRELFTFGREGEGPGEFFYPRAIAVGPNDTLLVVDSQRINVFSPSGTFVRSYSCNPLGLTGAYVTTMRVAVDGTMYLCAFDYFGTKVIHEVSPAGKKVASFADVANLNVDAAVKATSVGGVIDLAPNGDVVYSQRTPYEITRFASGGRLLSTIHRDNKFISPPRVERVGDGYNIRIASGSYGLVVLDDGRIINEVMIAEYDTWKNDTGEDVIVVLDVFDSRGRLAGTCELAQRVVLKCSAPGNRFYALKTDDFFTVVRYRLE